VLAALGVVVWSRLIVCSVECAIDSKVRCALNDGMVYRALDNGMVVCVLNDALLLHIMRLLELDFVDMLGTVEVSAVGGM